MVIIPRRIIPRFSPSLSWTELFSGIIKFLFSNRLFTQECGRNYINNFEAQLSKYIGVPFVVFMPSARAGLKVLLKTLPLEKGDEVLMPCFYFFSMPSAVINSGGTPVFIDINPEDFLMDLSKVEKMLSEKTRVIVPTHLFGTSQDMLKIEELSQKFNLKVIEDCAQSFGGSFKGKKLGSFGDASVFTFGITKNFTTLQGGAVCIKSEEWAQKVRLEREKFCKENFLSITGYVIKTIILKLFTSRLLFSSCLYPILQGMINKDPVELIFTEKPLIFSDKHSRNTWKRPGFLQAIIGLEQLKRIDLLTSRRTFNGKLLERLLKQQGNVQGKERLEEKDKIYMNFPILVNKRNVKMRELRRLGVDTTTGYMVNCAELAIFKNFARDYGQSYENTRMVMENIVHLPMYPSLSEKDITYIAECVNKICY